MKKNICTILILAVLCVFLGVTSGCQVFGDKNDKKKDPALSDSMSDFFQNERLR